MLAENRPDSCIFVVGHNKIYSTWDAIKSVFYCTDDSYTMVPSGSLSSSVLELLALVLTLQALYIILLSACTY